MSEKKHPKILAALVTMKDGSKFYRVVFDYDPVIINEIKKIPGRSWNQEAKAWYVPAEGKNALEILGASFIDKEACPIRKKPILSPSDIKIFLDYITMRYNIKPGTKEDSLMRELGTIVSFLSTDQLKVIDIDFKSLDKAEIDLENAKNGFEREKSVLEGMKKQGLDAFHEEKFVDELRNRTKKHEEALNKIKSDIRARNSRWKIPEKFLCLFE